MEQASPTEAPLAAGTAGLPSASDSDEYRAFAAVVASVERLDALGLATEAGLATVEPATTFRLG